MIEGNFDLQKKGESKKIEEPPRKKLMTEESINVPNEESENDSPLAGASAWA